MEQHEVIQIVKEASEACGNLWFNVKTRDTKYFKIRLFINSNGQLRTYEKRSIDKTTDVDTSNWVRVLPRLSSKTQQYRSNITRIYDYLVQSGLWQEFLPDITKLMNISDEEILVTYEQNRKEQRAFLDRLGTEHITVQMLRDLLYEQKCIRSVYYGHKNMHIKEELQQALKDNVAYKKTWRVTYDNTITYDPQEHKAYYSEKYRDRPYGHHYMLLDDMHITFRIEK